MALAPLATAGVSVSADTLGTTLRIEVAADGPRQAQVVLTHDDGLGATVDLALPVQLTNGTVAIELPALRSGVNFTATVLEGDDLPRDANGYLDAGQLLGLVPLASGLLPALPARTVDQPLLYSGFPITTASQTGVSSLLVLADGTIAAAWYAPKGTQDASCTLELAVSHDGGRTFGAPVRVLEQAVNGLSHWSWAAPSTGGVVLLARGNVVEDSSNIPQTPVLKWYDADANLVSQAEVPAATGFTAMAAGPQGTVLAAWPGQVGGTSGVQVWSLAQGAQPAAVGGTPLARVESLDIAADGARLALVAFERVSAYELRPRLSWSSDGGASWSVAAEPAGLHDLTLGMGWSGYDGLGLAFGDGGDLHLALSSLPGHPTGGPPPPMGSGTALHLRFAPGSMAPTITPMTGPGSIAPALAGSESPVLAVSGTRVWVQFNQVTATSPSTGRYTTYAAESLDGGRTFAALYPTRTVSGHLPTFHASAILPDDRPAYIGYYRTDGAMQLSFMPLFDPEPRLDGLFVKVSTLPAEPPEAKEPAEAAPAEAEPAGDPSGNSTAAPEAPDDEGTLQDPAGPDGPADEEDGPADEEGGSTGPLDAAADDLRPASGRDPAPSDPGSLPVPGAGAVAALAALALASRLRRPKA